jgi:hypothetical protein
VIIQATSCTGKETRPRQGVASLQCQGKERPSLMQTQYASISMQDSLVAMETVMVSHHHSQWREEVEVQ